MSDIPELEPQNNEQRRAISKWRIAGAFGIALLVSLAAFALAASVPNEGQAFAGVAFLLIMPAALSAFVAYVADPMHEKPYRFYAAIPLILTFIAVLLGAVILREGVVCIVMLSPIWIGSGLVGVSALYAFRTKRSDPNRVNASVLLLLPLLAIQLEPMFPVPVAQGLVRSDIVIAAAPEKIWPHLLAMPGIAPGEGRWNVSQNVLGIPRPSSAVVVRTADGLVRKAEWRANARFDEVITGMKIGQAIRWRFHFPDDSIRRYTDAHVDPAGHTMRIETGGYRIEPLPDGTSRLVLETGYRMQTPLSGYASFWGQFFLGDIQNNVLAIVKNRAER
jgi:hypothetical protein